MARPAARRALRLAARRRSAPPAVRRRRRLGRRRLGRVALVAAGAGHGLERAERVGGRRDRRRRRVCGAVRVGAAACRRRRLACSASSTASAGLDRHEREREGRGERGRGGGGDQQRGHSRGDRRRPPHPSTTGSTPGGRSARRRCGTCISAWWCASFQARVAHEVVDRVVDALIGQRLMSTRRWLSAARPATRPAGSSRSNAAGRAGRRSLRGPRTSRRPSSREGRFRRQGRDLDDDKAPLPRTRGGVAISNCSRIAGSA